MQHFMTTTITSSEEILMRRYIILDTKETASYYDVHGECESRRILGFKLSFMKQHGLFERIEALQRVKVDECLAEDSGASADLARQALLTKGRLIALLLVQSKWDEANSLLMELIPSIDLDVTDRLFDDVNGCYDILHLKYRSADAKETIVSTNCQEAFLRHWVSACERQYSSDHPEAEKYRDALIKATTELTSFLVKANRKDDAESVARLCVATAKAALDAVSASNVHDDNWKRHD